MNIDMEKVEEILLANARWRRERVGPQPYSNLEVELAAELQLRLVQPEDGGITQALAQMARDNALEEAADLADQKLDVYSGTLCTYRGDVAEAIRGLKSEPQKQEPK